MVRKWALPKQSNILSYCFELGFKNKQKTEAKSSIDKKNMWLKLWNNTKISIHKYIFNFNYR